LYCLKSYAKDYVSVSEKLHKMPASNLAYDRDPFWDERFYCVYTEPVGETMVRHRTNYHCYSDDIQVYVTLKPGRKSD